MAKPLPTDLEILDEIYERYHDEYVNFKGKTAQRPAKNFVPIDVQAIANALRVDADIVFSRLYYHLQEKHAIDEKNRVGGAPGGVSFYMKYDGGHLVNFPLLTSVLAALRDDERKYRNDRLLSIVAIAISVVAIIAGAWFR